MILYNVTVKVDNSIEADWLEWMRSKHIPDVMNTGMFLEHKLCKITFPTEDDGHNTFAIQYFCKSMDELNAYQDKYAKALQAEHTERYNNRFIAIRTLMEVLD